MMHYTITNIPDELDRALRERAAAEHKSLEAIIVDVLAGVLNTKTPHTHSSHPRRQDDSLDGKSRWKADPEFEAALRDQKLIDWDAWSDGIKRRDLTGIAGQNLISPEMKIVFGEQRRVDPDLWK
jgi:Antitoxin FitA-like, ribbon-helix-helix